MLLGARIAGCACDVDASGRVVLPGSSGTALSPAHRRPSQVRCHRVVQQTPSSSAGSAGTNEPRHTWPGDSPKAKPAKKSSAASSATSPARSIPPSAANSATTNTTDQPSKPPLTSIEASGRGCSRRAAICVASTRPACFLPYRVTPSHDISAFNGQQPMSAGMRAHAARAAMAAKAFA